jgi:hypothetical protein
MKAVGYIGGDFTVANSQPFTKLTIKCPVRRLWDLMRAAGFIGDEFTKARYLLSFTPLCPVVYVNGTENFSPLSKSDSGLSPVQQYSSVTSRYL